MTEEEKCMAGMLYDCHDESFIKRKARATQWCERYARRRRACKKDKGY